MSVLIIDENLRAINNLNVLAVMSDRQLYLYLMA